MESTTKPPSEDDEWELYNDDGLVYKRRKRHPLHPDLPDPQPPAPPETRRDRKRNALLKLRDEFRREIAQWEHLSNTLCAMEATTAALLRQTPSPESLQPDESSPSPRVPATVSVVDELLLQVETQEAIIRDASNLCDVAEAICNAQEEEEHQSLIDLPIWAFPASPRKLLASLCDQ